MQSMTGYSYIEKSTNQFSFSVEIKSLNSKFLEIFINLPKSLRREENKLTQLMKDRFERGKIVLNIEIFDWIQERQISINRDILKKYYKEVKDIEREFGRENLFSGDILFSFENVIHTGKTTISAQSYKSIFDTIDSAIDKTIKMRLKEGVSTRKDIQNSLNIIQNNSLTIKKAYKDISKITYNKIKKSLDSISENKIKDDRLFTEVAILVDKLDVNEEIVRLGDHIQKFKSIMTDNTQIGKRLDFLAQEMFREVNTISSKASKSDIAYLVIDMKNHIDKIREHSRNIM